MEEWRCCRFCLGVQSLNPIFAMPEHSEKYSDIILAATGLKVEKNDPFSQLSCYQCINFINESYKFRKKCETSQLMLKDRAQKPLYEIKIEPCVLKPEQNITIDITELIDDFREFDDNIALNEYHLEVSKAKTEITIDEPKEVEGKKVTKKRGTKKDRGEKKEKKLKEKEEIECELCHKVLTSRLSLRNHNKIHTGFDVVLLMHCKAKHGYEKTDKCSYCDYRASNAEQVKIHERLHTGEKPFACNQCGAAFHRRSSYLQHVAIHLPEKTVQCEQCPARFKSVTLMRIHQRRHRPPRYRYRCRQCDATFARRRNAARHLARAHGTAAEPSDGHILRDTCG